MKGRGCAMRFITCILATFFLFLVCCDSTIAVDKSIDDTVVIDEAHAPYTHHGIGWEHDGKRSGKWLFYYKNNTVYTQRHYNSMGVFDGQWLEFYEQGGLAVIGQCERGKPVGIWIGFHENGKMRYMANFGDSIAGFLNKPIMEWFTNDGIPRKEGVAGVTRSIEDEIKRELISK